MTWRSDCVLLRLPALRTRFPPREWDHVRRVRLAVGVHVVHLDVVVVDTPTCHGGQRRWLRCPNVSAGCRRLTSVVGINVTTGVVGCRVCMERRSVADPRKAEGVMNQLNTREAAVHEAGHAVMMELLDIPYDRVSIAGGRPRCAGRWVSNVERTLDPVRRAFMTLTAGTAAQWVCSTGRRTRSGATSPRAIMTTSSPPSCSAPSRAAEARSTGSCGEPSICSSGTLAPSTRSRTNCCSNLR